MALERPSLINEKWLRGALESVPADLADHSGDRQQWVCLSVLKHFFGRDWLGAHVLGSEAKGFLANVFNGDSKTRLIRAFRVTELAEMLYNLQRIDGFYQRIAQMREGQVESTYAELDFGRLLHVHKVPFRFIVPQYRRGFDYDFEIIYPDGLVACADAKCKLEASQFSHSAVRNSLKEAREQLPQDRPGIAFVKVPADWIDDPAIPAELENISAEYLQKTGRMVSIKFYVSTVIYGDEVSHHVMRFKEISNPRNSFDTTRDWDLFEGREIPEGGWNGMPDHWFRLANFPIGAPLDRDDAYLGEMPADEEKCPSPGSSRAI